MNATEMDKHSSEMDKPDTKNKDRGAFACSDSEYLQKGLTKREYFAAKIMQGLVNTNFTSSGFQNTSEKGLADLAVKCSDALLKSLDR